MTGVINNSAIFTTVPRGSTSVDNDSRCAVCHDQLFGAVDENGVEMEVMEHSAGQVAHQVHEICLRSWLSQGSPPRCPLGCNRTVLSVNGEPVKMQGGNRIRRVAATLAIIAATAGIAEVAGVERRTLTTVAGAGVYAALIALSVFGLVEGAERGVGALALAGLVSVVTSLTGVALVLAGEQGAVLLAIALSALGLVPGVERSARAE